MLKNKFVLGSIAPRTITNGAITQAFRSGLITLSPESNWGLARWQLRHEPSGGILAEFDRADLRIGRLVLARIGGWDWSGSSAAAIPKATRSAWVALKTEFELDKSTPEIQKAIVIDMRSQRGMR
jgi:hypothetical protein